jgi:adenosylmethionine-8-amino-7-oxononanoate aminotransferase
VGDVRGAGFFYAVELVKDQATKQSFSAAEREELLRGFVLPRLLDAGVIMRVDDRGDAVVQLAPPLIAGVEELDTMEQTLRRVLDEAASRFC